MVDIVCSADTKRKVIKIRNGCEYIVNNNMVRNKVIVLNSDFLFKRFLVVAALFKDFAKNSVRNLFVDTESLLVNIAEAVDFNHSVRNDFYFSAAFELNKRNHNTCVLNFFSLCRGNCFAFVGKELTLRGDNRLRENLVGKSVSDAELLVVLIAAYS